MIMCLNRLYIIFFFPHDIKTEITNMAFVIQIFSVAFFREKIKVLWKNSQQWRNSKHSECDRIFLFFSSSIKCCENYCKQCVPGMPHCICTKNATVQCKTTDLCYLPEKFWGSYMLWRESRVSAQALAYKPSFFWTLSDWSCETEIVDKQIAPVWHSATDAVRQTL